MRWISTVTVPHPEALQYQPNLQRRSATLTLPWPLLHRVVRGKQCDRRRSISLYSHTPNKTSPHTLVWHKWQSWHTHTMIGEDDPLALTTMIHVGTYQYSFEEGDRSTVSWLQGVRASSRKLEADKLLSDLDVEHPFGTSTASLALSYGREPRPRAQTGCFQRAVLYKNHPSSSACKPTAHGCTLPASTTSREVLFSRFTLE